MVTGIARGHLFGFAPLLLTLAFVARSAGARRLLQPWVAAPTVPPPPPCPGYPGPQCSGRGDCQNGICWCQAGFGGSDCGTEIPLFMEVTSILPPELHDMKGRYRLDGMYLAEVRDPMGGFGVEPLPSQVKFVHYDYASDGWAVSKFNSSCIDDICFFAYGVKAPDDLGQVPPANGYVYGGPVLHVYYKDLLFDDATHNPLMKKGYHLSVSYTPDPTVMGVPDLSEYNGKYVLQPRYTHMVNKKYAIMPTSLKSPGKKWVVTGLMGEPRTRQIILSATDPSENRYMPPVGGPWIPEGLGFKVKPACANHVGNNACQLLEPQCMMANTDGAWVRQCCRDTCNSCSVSRLLCPLPKVLNLVAAAMKAKRFKARMAKTTLLKRALGQADNGWPGGWPHG